MKSKIIISLLFFINFVWVWNAQAQNLTIKNWEDVGQINYTSATMQGSRAVLATAHGYLYSTIDFGATWQRYKLDDTLSLSSVAFADTMHGLVLDNTNIEFRTSDGGSTWVPGTVPVKIMSLAYPQEDTAFAIGNDSAVWRTTDAGISWSKIFSVPLALHAMSFLNARTGFIGGDSAILFSTMDAGKTWIRRNGGLTAIAGVQGDRSILSISFYDETVGVIGTDSSFWTTSDSGKNWLIHNVPNIYITYNGGPPPIPLVMAIDAHSVVVVDANALNYYSSDLGNTVSGATPSDFDQVLPNCWVKTPNGYLLAGNSELVEASISGQEWKTISETPPNGTTAIQNITDTKFGAIGDESNYFFSDDSGIIWRVQDLWLRGGGYFDGYKGLHFFNSDSGIIYNSVSYYENFVTTDGGVTWAEIDSLAGLSGPVRGSWLFWQLSFSSDGMGIGLKDGNDPLIYVTTDGSRTWFTDTIKDSTPGPYPGLKIEYSIPNSVYCLDAGRAYLSVEDWDTLGSMFESYSILLATTDSGHSWHRIPNTPDTPYTNSIVFRNIDTGIIFNTGNFSTGATFLTTDRGQHWTRLGLPPEVGAGSFLNDSTIFAWPYKGDVIYYSTNLGLNWHTSRIPVPSALRNSAVRQILYPSKNTIYLWTNFGYFKADLEYGAAGITQFGDSLSQFLYVQTYPDPASTILHVRLSGTYSNRGAPLTAGIYDFLGRKVMDLTQLADNGNNGNTSEFAFNTIPFVSGVYVLHYTLGADSFGKPFVILH